MKSSLTARRVQPCKSEAVEEPRARIEALEPLHVAMNDDILPRNERVIEYEDGVVLVETRRERIIPRGAGGGGGKLVGRSADQLDAGRVHRRNEHHHHAWIGNLLAHVLTEEVIMGERRVGGHHLGARDVDARVRLFLDGDVDILDLLDRLVAVDRRIDEGVVEIEHRLLRSLVPGARVVGELSIELGIGTERIEECGLVVGTAAHPAVRDAGPGGDRITLRDDIPGRAGNLEELMRVAAGAGIGRRSEHVLGLGIVQRIIEQGDGGNRIAEGRMRRDISDTVAVNVDFAPIAQELEELSPGERTFLAFENCLGGLRHGGSKVLCVGGELVALVSRNRQGRPSKLARNRRLRIAKNRRAVCGGECNRVPGLQLP